MFHVAAFAAPVYAGMHSDNVLDKIACFVVVLAMISIIKESDREFIKIY